MTETIFWLSRNPLKCDTCPKPITNVFYDIKTVGGPWGCLCPDCAMKGPGIGRLGTGLGQKYECLHSGRFIKTEG